MAYKNSHGIKTVSEETYNAMKDAVPQCVSLIEECNKGDGFLNKFACIGSVKYLCQNACNHKQ